MYSTAGYPSASAAPPLAHPSPLPTVFAPRISAPFAQQPQRQKTRHDRRIICRHRTAAAASRPSASSHPTRRPSFQTSRQCVVAESPRHCAESPQTSATPARRGAGASKAALRHGDADAFSHGSGAQLCLQPLHRLAQLSGQLQPGLLKQVRPVVHCIALHINT